MSWKEILEKRIKEDTIILNEIKSLERQIASKDKEIVRLQKEKEVLEHELDNVPASSIDIDAKLIADGEKRMPDGYYREAIKESANFEYTHKRQG